MKKVSRIGVYGILLHDGMMALVNKKKGPYNGLLDLPGGGIEFGESPVETLKREIHEELAFEISELTFHENYSYLGTFEGDVAYQFHHLGLVYRINHFEFIPGVTGEEEWSWYAIDTLNPKGLTPFTFYVYSALTTHV